MLARTKVILGLVVLCSLVLLGGAVGIRGLRDVDESLERCAAETAPATLALAHLRATSSDVRGEAVDLAMIELSSRLSGRRDAAAAVAASQGRLDEALADMDEWLSIYGAPGNGPARERLAAELAKAAAPFKAAAARPLGSAGAALMSKDISEWTAELDAGERRFRRLVDNGLQMEMAEFEAVAAAGAETARRALNVSRIVGVASLVFAMAFGSMLIVTVVKPLGKLRDAAVEASHGNLDVRVDSTSRGEIGVVAKAFDNMMESLSSTTVSKEYVDSIIRSMADALIVIAPDGNIRTVNQAALTLLGFSEQDLIGRPVGTVLDEGSMKGSVVGTLITEGTVKGWELTCHTRTGGVIDLSVSGAAMRSDCGALLGVVLVAQDLSDRKRAERERIELETQVQHTQKLESLGVLAGGIAHDFNNLLTGILGNAEIAAMNIDKPTRALNNIQQVKAAAERAAELSNQMLAYSGRGNFAVDVVDLSGLIDGMRSLLETSCTKKADLRYVLADDMPETVADLSQVRQVVLNLVVNASDALGEDEGIITIKTGVTSEKGRTLSESYLNEALPDGEYAFLEVADTGCGMSDGTRGKVFDPFFTTKFTGRGLGLAAVLGIVRGHQGAIDVQSVPGEGTVFTVYLPVVTRDKTARERSADARGARAAGASGVGEEHNTILLVDDEQVVRDVAARVLQRSGFSVIEAGDGREALSLFSRHAKDIACVVLDLTMPTMNGDETYRELRRMDRSVPVILSSGYSEEEVVGRFNVPGISGFVQKPYPLATLASTVRAAVEGCRGAQA